MGNFTRRSVLAWAAGAAGASVECVLPRQGVASWGTGTAACTTDRQRGRSAPQTRPAPRRGSAGEHRRGAPRKRQKLEMCHGQVCAQHAPRCAPPTRPRSEQSSPSPPAGACHPTPHLFGQALVAQVGRVVLAGQVPHVRVHCKQQQGRGQAETKQRLRQAKCRPSAVQSGHQG